MARIGDVTMMDRRDGLLTTDNFDMDVATFGRTLVPPPPPTCHDRHTVGSIRAKARVAIERISSNRGNNNGMCGW